MAHSCVWHSHMKAHSCVWHSHINVFEIVISMSHERHDAFIRITWRTSSATDMTHSYLSHCAISMSHVTRVISLVWISDMRYVMCHTGMSDIWMRHLSRMHVFGHVSHMDESHMDESHVEESHMDECNMNEWHTNASHSFKWMSRIWMSDIPMHSCATHSYATHSYSTHSYSTHSYEWAAHQRIGISLVHIGYGQ